MRCLRFILFIKLCFFSLYGVESLLDKIFSKETLLVNYFKKFKKNKCEIDTINIGIKKNSLALEEKEAFLAIGKDKLELTKQNLFDKGIFLRDSLSRLKDKQELITYKKKIQLDYNNVLESENMKQYSLREFMLPVACFVIAGGMLYLKFDKNYIHFVPLFCGSYTFVNEFWR